MKMTKYLSKGRKTNYNEVVILKSFTYVIIWTLLFIFLGVYINFKVSDFTEKYISKIEIIETYIENDDLNSAKDSLSNISNSWHKEKSIWYKTLNHDNFDLVCLYLNILEKSIDINDKSNSLEYIVKIKMTLDNILESEKLDLNHIM